MKKKKYSKAFEYIKKAIDLGSIEALSLLASCYFYGNGIQQDYKKAFELCLKSVELGNFGLHMYFEGKGNDRDIVKALNCF